MPTPGFVYPLASRRNGTLYAGVTSDLVRRIDEHRTGSVPGFTSRYGVARLVYVEAHPDVRDAIRREKQIERWRRAWKLRLIGADNPEWRDLYGDWCEAQTRSRPAGRAALPPASGASRPTAPVTLDSRLRGNDS